MSQMITHLNQPINEGEYRVSHPLRFDIHRASFVSETIKFPIAPHNEYSQPNTARAAAGCAGSRIKEPTEEHPNGRVILLSLTCAPSATGNVKSSEADIK